MSCMIGRRRESTGLGKVPDMVTPQLKATSILVAAKEHISSKLGDGIVMLGLRSGFYYSLNASGAKIWEMVQSPRSISEIVTALQALYETDSERILQDVLYAVKDMLSHGLLEIVPGRAEE